MTVANPKGVYIVGKRKPDADNTKIANAKRMAEAIKRNSEFGKKKKDVERSEFELVSKENIGLAELFSVNPFSCKNPDFYTKYIKFNAIWDKNSGHAVTHLLLDKVKNRIMGYVSLRASSIISNDENNTLVGKAAIEIYTLAVDNDYEGSGVGRALIDHAPMNYIVNT